MGFVTLEQLATGRILFSSTGSKRKVLSARSRYQMSCGIKLLFDLGYGVYLLFSEGSEKGVYIAQPIIISNKCKKTLAHTQ